MQETATSESRAIGLIFVFRMVFPNFPVQIPVSSEILLINQKNLVVDEVTLFKKVLAFWKLMLRIGKILCAKVG